MTLNSLQALAWSTVAGAVVSALLLASGASDSPEWAQGARADAAAPRPRDDIGRLQDPLGAQRAAAITVSETQRQPKVR